MNFFYCVLCKRAIALKHKCSHYISKFPSDNDKSIFNKYIIMKPELSEKNDIIKSHVNTYNRRFRFHEIECNCKLIVVNDVSNNVKSNNTMYNTEIPSLNFEKCLKGRIIQYKKEGLNFSLMIKMNITFVTNYDQITYKHYLERPMPMVQRLINKKLSKNYGLIKTLDGIDGTLHKTWYETGVAEMPYVSDEDE